jgi:hypothetical protein
MALPAVGPALVQQGRTVERMSLLDEAMAGVVGGEAGDPLTVAQMSCMTMVGAVAASIWSGRRSGCSHCKASSTGTAAPSCSPSAAPLPPRALRERRLGRR